MADAHVGGIAIDIEIDPVTYCEPVWKEEGPMSDLLYVERIINTVQHRLAAMEGESEDVEVAARCRQLARAFPAYFLRWAASIHELDESMAAQSVQRRCDDIPLFANINKLDEVKNVGLDKMALPPICVEALVLVNAGLPKNEGEWVARERQIAKTQKQFQDAFQKGQAQALRDQMAKIHDQQADAVDAINFAAQRGLMGTTGTTGTITAANANITSPAKSPLQKHERTPAKSLWGLGDDFLRKFGL